MKPYFPSPSARAIALALLAWTAPAHAATTNVVTLSGFNFSPSSLTISEGDVIVFRNTSGFHSATCEQNPPNCGSHALASSPWTSTNQFDVAGTYRYRCTQHSSSFSSGMIFSVTVLPAGTHLVTLSGTQFTPPTLTIPVGDSVMFKNSSGSHSATCEQADPVCGSHELQLAPWTLTYQFTVAGSYRYRCIAHSVSFASGMIMTVNVQGPPATPARLENPRIQDGEIRFSVSGTPGGIHVVEGSEDFVNWAALKTNIPPDGIFGFAEPVALSRRYYRVRQ